MGIWLKSPGLLDHETVRWKKFANRTQGNRAVGGCLYLTERRLIFEPNRFDAVTKGRSWSAWLKSIESVGTEAPNGYGFSGGLRTRLRLDLDDGHSECFVVNGVQDVITELDRAIQG